MKLTLSFQLSTSDAETLEQIGRVAVKPLSIDEASTRAILFMRAAAGRASLCLSAFYLFLGAESSTDEQRKEWPYPHTVRHYTLRYSAMGTIALAARAIFDHGKDGLHAKMVTKLSAKDMEEVAAYWAHNDPSRLPDARLALAFVQSVLARCAISIKEANQSKCILARRVACLKAYADREAAHISMHHYEYTMKDVVHVASAIALFGAVIHDFDKGEEGAGLKFLVDIDKGAYDAAVEIFPELKQFPRLFERGGEAMLRNLYKGKLRAGADYLSTWLLPALGWDNMPKEFWSHPQQDTPSSNSPATAASGQATRGRNRPEQ